MKKSKFTEEQIAFALRQAESGTTVGDALGGWAGFHAFGIVTLGGASFGMGLGGTVGMLLCADMVAQ